MYWNKNIKKYKKQIKKDIKTFREKNGDFILKIICKKFRKIVIILND